MNRLINAVIVVCLCLPAAVNADFLIAMPEGDYFPQYDTTQGDARGFLPEVIAAFAKTSGQGFIIQPFPIKRYQRLLKSGQVDFILPSNPLWTDARNLNGLHFSAVIMISRSGFVRKRANKGTPVRALATVSGYTLPKIPKQYRHGNVETHRTVNTFASLEMLRANRVDSVYAHLDYVRSWLRNNQLKGYLVFEPDIGYDNFSYHLATLQHPDIIAQFDQWMGQNPNLIKSLKTKYHVGSESLLE